MTEMIPLLFQSPRERGVGKHPPVAGSVSTGVWVKCPHGGAKRPPQNPQYDWNNDPSNQVDHLQNEQHMGYLRKTALKAYHNAEGIRAVEKARKKIVKKGFQNKMVSQKKLGSTITNIILNMAGTPEEYEQAAIERKQNSKIKRHKLLTNQELLNRSSSGGRAKRTHKKRVHKKRQTRR